MPRKISEVLEYNILAGRSQVEVIEGMVKHFHTKRLHHIIELFYTFDKNLHVRSSLLDLRISMYDTLATQEIW